MAFLSRNGDCDSDPSDILTEISDRGEIFALEDNDCRDNFGFRKRKWEGAPLSANRLRENVPFRVWYAMSPFRTSPIAHIRFNKPLQKQIRRNRTHHQSLSPGDVEVVHLVSVTRSQRTRKYERKNTLRPAVDLNVFIAKECQILW